MNAAVGSKECRWAACPLGRPPVSAGPGPFYPVATDAADARHTIGDAGNSAHLSVDSLSLAHHTADAADQRHAALDAGNLRRLATDRADTRHFLTDSTATARVATDSPDQRHRLTDAADLRPRLVVDQPNVTKHRTDSPEADRTRPQE